MAPRKPRPGPGNGNSGTFEMLQAVLRSQEAANEATRQAMQDINIAVNGMASSVNRLVDPFGTGGGGGYGAGSSRSGPTFNGDGVRPLGGGYYGSPYGPGKAVNHGHGLAGLRNTLARNLNARFGTGAGNRFEQVHNAEGRHVGYREYDQQGRLVGEHNLRWAGTEEGSAALAGAVRRGGVSRVLGGLSGGGALGAARAVPYVGAFALGAEAVHEGLTQITEQRAKNAQYQSIYNGTNMQGMGQRFGQMGFQLGQLFSGGMTWGQSQEAFRDVSSLGLQGSDRNTDLNFISQNYKQMGISVADSFKLIQSATSDLNISLTGLHQSLVATRQAAALTGQNANIGQQILTGNLTTLNSQYASSSGGTTNLAGVLSTIQAGLGREMSGVSLAPMLTNPSILQQLGPNIGLNYTQLMGRIQAGDPSVLTALTTQMSKGLSGITGNQRVMQYINQQVNAAGGPQALDAQTVNRITTSVLNNPNLALSIQAATATGNAFTGLNLTGDQWLNFAVQQASHTGLYNTNQIRNYGLENPYYHHDNSGIYGLTGHLIGHNTSGYVNPVIDAVRANKQISNAGIEIREGSKTKIVSLAEAIQKDPVAVAKGTAIVAGTGGQTVAQMLGGLHQDYFVGSRGDKIYMPPDDPRTKRASAERLRLDAAYAKAFAHSADGGNPFDLHLPTAGDIAGAMGGVSRSEYQKIEAYVASRAPNKTATSKGTDKGGKVVVSLQPEVAALFNFNGSGNVSIANAGAAAGSVPAVGH